MMIDGERYGSQYMVLVILTAFFFLLFDSKRDYSQMTSFLRKFIVGQAKREREGRREGERKERSIIFDFNVYVDVVYLGSSRALFSHNKGHIPFSLSLFYFRILFCFLYFCRLSVSLR